MSDLLIYSKNPVWRHLYWHDNRQGNESYKTACQLLPCGSTRSLAYYQQPTRACTPQWSSHEENGSPSYPSSRSVYTAWCKGFDWSRSYGILFYRERPSDAPRIPPAQGSREDPCPPIPKGYRKNQNWKENFLTPTNNNWLCQYFWYTVHLSKITPTCGTIVLINIIFFILLSQKHRFGGKLIKKIIIIIGSNSLSAQWLTFTKNYYYFQLMPFQRGKRTRLTCCARTVLCSRLNIIYWREQRLDSVNENNERVVIKWRHFVTQCSLPGSSGPVLLSALPLGKS